jgi:uncharacterized C2H2 Zn-finger protein
MLTTKEDRRRLRRMKHEHDNGGTVSVLECPRCPRYLDAASKVLGRFPTWYPSQPSKRFLQCPRCELVWEARE